MSKGRPKILFAGGGTGGHLFPALAIADEIKKLRPDVEILFVGTSDKIEARIVPQRGYAFTTIWIGGFQRRFTVNNFTFPLKVLVSMVQSMSLIKKFQPDVVVGTGGYVCGPVLSVSSIRGIPTVVHESNSYPGITTRLIAHRAAKVFTTFAVTNRWLRRKDNVELVGTPVRQSFGRASRKESLKFFGLHPGRKTVLVFGGSQGAVSINAAVRDMLSGLVGSHVQLIWQTGEKDFPSIRQQVVDKGSVWVGPFIDRMDYAYAAADVVVCRAGATTIAELTAIGKPAILIPYPYAAADHQTQNAKTLADAGAARLITDKEMPAKLKNEILSVLNDKKLVRRMSAASKKLGRPRAGKEIAGKILDLIV